MISLVIFAVILFALWAWLAYEYKTAIPLSPDDELELENWIAANAAEKNIFASKIE